MNAQNHAETLALLLVDSRPEVSVPSTTSNSKKHIYTYIYIKRCVDIYICVSKHVQLIRTCSKGREKVVQRKVMLAFLAVVHVTQRENPATARALVHFEKPLQSCSRSQSFTPQQPRRGVARLPQEAVKAVLGPVILDPSRIS